MENDKFTIIKQSPTSKLAWVDLYAGIDIALLIAEAIASFVAQKVLEEMVSVDPIDVSHQTLDQIAEIIRAAVEEGRKEDYENLVRSSVEKFILYDRHKEDIFYLENIATSNIDAISGLRDIGPGGILAWMMGVQNIMAAYVAWGETDASKLETVKDIAARHIPEAYNFLDEAIAHNNQRVSEITCDPVTEPDGQYYQCCFELDGEKHCKKYRTHSRARSRCEQERNDTIDRITKQAEVELFNPIKVIIQEWEKIKDSNS